MAGGDGVRVGDGDGGVTAIVVSGASDASGGVPFSNARTTKSTTNARARRWSTMDHAYAAA
jgi:hypothetical protein